MAIKDYHNRAMKLLYDRFDTTAIISYDNKSYSVKTLVHGLSDADISTGKYSSSTLYFSFRIDDLKSAKERKTGKTGCIITGFKGRDIIYKGTKYSIDAENPNGSTEDIVILRGVVASA